MASIPRDIIAKRGDLVMPRWKRMLQFIRNTGVVPGPGVTISQGPNGTFVYADKKYRPWRSPFKVSATSTYASIRAGTVNGIYPYIDGIPISGIDDEGETIVVPDIKIEHGGQTKTYIALVAHTREGPRGIQVEDDPELLQIQHVTEIDPLLTQGGSPDMRGTAVYPLAALYWVSKGVLNTSHQIVHHNLGHRFVPVDSDQGQRSRHFFWAA